MDGTNTALIFTSTTPNLILTPQVQRTISTTGTPNSLLITFTSSNPVPTNGVIKITFPPESDAVVFASGVVGDITYNTADNTVTVVNKCSSGACLPTSVKSVTLSSSYVRNIGWIKSPLGTTDSF